MTSALAAVLTPLSTSEYASHLADLLNLPLFSEWQPNTRVDRIDYLDVGNKVLYYDEQGLRLQTLGKKQAMSDVQVDFLSNGMQHRLTQSEKLLSKAIGYKIKKPLRVLDATAGMGTDAFIMAWYGCDVTLLERHPVVHALLSDGLARAQYTDDMQVQSVLQHMHLQSLQDAKSYLNTSQQPFDIVYLDPMFPPTGKSALVKKNMQYFHHIVGEDDDAAELLGLAEQCARYRVVVKRGKKAPFLAEKAPNLQVEGKSSRFDVYTIEAMQPA